MQSSDDSQIDWSGIQPDRSPIAQLDADTFTSRLRMLSERALSLTILRRSFAEQQDDGQQLSGDSEPTARQSS